MLVISDVHGCYKTLLKLIRKLPKGEEICFVGDLIDRGPSSAQVVDYVRRKGYHVVMGNHEAMMLEWTGRFSDMMWIGNGGKQTLDSYTKINHLDPDGKFWPVPEREFNKKKFENHKKWISKLPLHLEFPDCINVEGRHLIVSHSLILNVYKTLDRRRYEETVLWTRDFRHNDIPNLFNIIGHTPQSKGPRIRNTYAIIDTGCCFKNSDLGYLTAIQFPSMRIWQQKRIDQMNY